MGRKTAGRRLAPALTQKGQAGGTVTVTGLGPLVVGSSRLARGMLRRMLRLEVDRGMSVGAADILPLGVGAGSRLPAVVAQRRLLGHNRSPLRAASERQHMT